MAGYPTAVSTATKTPGVYMRIDLTASAASPGVGDLLVLLLCPKASDGDLAANSEIRIGGGKDSAATAFGVGGPGHLMAGLIYDQYPGAQIYFGAPTAGAGGATKDITFSGVPSANTSVLFSLGDTDLEVAWLASETADTFKARAVIAINNLTSSSPIAASSGGTGIVSITFKVNGNIGNDFVVRAVIQTASGTAASDTTSLANLVGGTTDPDYSTILAAAAATEFHYILIATSNADAEAASACNPARLATHISTYNNGLDAKLQQGIYASTGTQAHAKTGAVGRDVGYMQHSFALNGKGLPCQLAARECGGRLAAISIGNDPAANRIGEVLDGYVGSDDPLADKPTLAESEDAIGNGLSIVTYDRSGNAVDMRPVTTYSDDDRLLDVQNVDVAYIVMRDIATALPVEFPKAKIAKDAVAGAAPPPPNVTEERDVKSFAIKRLRKWAANGVIQSAPLETSITDGSLIVQVNDGDPTQVDLVLPFKAVQPVAKWGLVGQRVPG